MVTKKYPQYMDIRIYLNEETGEIDRVLKVKTLEELKPGTYVTVHTPGQRQEVEASEYIGASEPEGAWFLLDEGEGHPRIMVLEGSWEVDKE